MIDRVLKTECTGCGACGSVCPVSAITYVPEELSNTWFPQIDYDTCIRCQKCEDACPALHDYTPSAETTAYAAYAADGKTQLQASSGGVFPALAQEVLSRGGAVFGGAWVDGEVRHVCVEAPEELWKLSGSKYVQSKVQDAFIRAKALLDSGQLVYFSGTPCQIAGLLRFLQKPYDNLITQDLVCHGVPVPWLWKAYKAFLEEQHRSTLTDISFKDKRSGTWYQYYVTARFENGETYSVPFTKDPYMQLYLSDVCLRPACYNCKYKGQTRQSDITLADFWGVERVVPEMKHTKGVSLLLLHSEKGHDLFESVRSKLKAAPVSDIAKALERNPAALRPSPKPASYEAFWADAENLPFPALAQKYGAPHFKKSLPAKVRSLAGGILRKIGIRK
ncbi:MAG TPA: 4Fe-4S binding protein, partial [Clostridiales bacterium]|nr:4Fe-4S binding protein [Clostridiales bacterium]